jgi:putative peptide zinc metalloprotease protein
VEDRALQKFWRIGSLEYEVCSALDGRAPCSEIIQKLVARSLSAHEAGQDRIQKILIWLLQSGLAQEVHPVTGLPVENARFGPPAPSKAKRMFDPSSFRVPLLTGEALDKVASQFAWLVSWPCLLIAVAVWVVAIVTSIQNSQSLVDLGRKLFVPGSQWWWLLAWGILKLVHETGHAVACVRTGSKTKGAGLGFMFFAPMPYVDVTNLWRIESKWSRALVSAAGMLFEMTLAAVAILIACNSDNTSLRYLCFSIATLGTFTTLAFNGNPLMRFDGYYIFVDLIGRPNLWQDAASSIRTFTASWIFKTPNQQSWSVLLLAYGFASWISRTILLLTMAWGVWITWDGLGLIVVVFFVCLWFVLPILGRIRNTSTPLAGSSCLATLRSICPRKAIRAGLILAGIFLCSFLPSPIQVYWPATVEYVAPSEIRTETAGFVAEVLVHDGQGVLQGDEILRLSNPSLDLEWIASRSALQTSEEKCTVLRAQRKHSELQAEEANYASLQVKHQILDAKKNGLVLKASRAGVLLARMSHNLPGSFLPEGQSIGMIVDPAQIEVKASIPQDAWEVVAQSVHELASITLFTGQHLKGEVLETLPRTSDQLESSWLGGLYGGPLPVVMSKDAKGESQLKTESPRLQTRIRLLRDEPLPPPGALCSVRLQKHRESIWQTGYRWIKAAVQVHFHSPTT